MNCRNKLKKKRSINHIWNITYNNGILTNLSKYSTQTIETIRWNKRTIEQIFLMKYRNKSNGKKKIEPKKRMRYLTHCTEILSC